jgi:hypothetical protein
MRAAGCALCIPSLQHAWQHGVCCASHPHPIPAACTQQDVCCAPHLLHLARGRKFHGRVCRLACRSVLPRLTSVLSKCCARSGLRFSSRFVRVMPYSLTGTFRATEIRSCKRNTRQTVLGQSGNGNLSDAQRLLPRKGLVDGPTYTTAAPSLPIHRSAPKLPLRARCGNPPTVLHTP